MLRIVLLTLLFIFPLISNASESDERRTKQTKLDSACEKARQTALAPQKLAIYKECINKHKKSEEYCLMQGDNYNGDRVNGSPLFYDLPECETAFKYRSSYRKGN